MEISAVTVPLAAGPLGSAPPRYEWLRAHAPIAPGLLEDGTRVWLMTKYEDIRQVLLDARFSREAAAHLPGVGFGRLGDVGSLHSFVNTDDPDHKRLRRTVNACMSEKRLAHHEEFIGGIAADLINSMTTQSSTADLVGAFAEPFAGRTISRVVGIRWELWRDVLASGDLACLMSRVGSVAESRAARQRLVRKLAENIEAREFAKGSAGASLARARTAGTLSEDEYVDSVLSLLVAGQEGLGTALVKAVVLLLQHPDQLALLRAKPVLYANAVEEVVRFYASSNESFLRVAVADVRLADFKIAAGDIVMTPAVAANRDPQYFDDGRRFDVQRETRGHLGFGAGPHYCVGAALARIGMRMGIRMLFERLPKLAIVGDPERLYSRRETLLKFPSLTVTW